jgi:hypothetical protein
VRQHFGRGELGFLFPPLEFFLAQWRFSVVSCPVGHGHNAGQHSSSRVAQFQRLSKIQEFRAQICIDNDLCHG